MKYAVLYSSETGNTKEIAEEIFIELPENDKVIKEINSDAEIPEADVYFIGFGVHNKTCGIDVINLFEELEGSKVALFATCGLYPTDEYKKIIEKNVCTWLNDDCEYGGMFLCQSKTTSEQKEKFFSDMPDAYDKLERMFEEGNKHPDDDDLNLLYEFCNEMMQRFN